jgi:uncharacterized protein YndB with AHSA1/START domain
MSKFEREVEIDAPVEQVWTIMTDPSHLPEWFPGVDGVKNVSSIREGASFEWTRNDQTGRGTIAKVEPMKRLEIRTQMGDDEDAHDFQLRRSGWFLGLAADECRVHYSLDILMGGVLGQFVAGGNPKDAMQVKKVLHRLRRVVESA